MVWYTQSAQSCNFPMPTHASPSFPIQHLLLIKTGLISINTLLNVQMTGQKVMLVKTCKTMVQSIYTSFNLISETIVLQTLLPLFAFGGAGLRAFQGLC